MKKAAIITCLSISKNGAEAQYTVSGSEQLITGAETNDAPVKYLLTKAAENGTPVSRIACIVSKEAYADGQTDSSYCRFKEMIAAYVPYEVDFKIIPYDFYLSNGNIIGTIDVQQDKALSVYHWMADALKDYSEVYIDYTGGFRDTSFLTTVLIRYLEFINITCREIVYSNFIEKKLYSISYIYDMFQLLNAVSQFVETGSGKLLHNIYDSVQHEPTKRLVKCIQKFSNVILLCDIKEVDSVMEELTEAMHKLESDTIQPAEPGIQVHIFRELLQVIKEKFYLEGDNTSFTYPKLIKWCVDNALLQQALTLYTEKMPIAYIRTGIVKQLPCSEKKKPGTSPEAHSFYTTIYQDILSETDKVDAFINLVETVKSKHEVLPNYAKNLKEVRENCSDEQLKAAINRVVKFLNSHYFGCDYSSRNTNLHNLNWSYCGILVQETNGKKFLNKLASNFNLAYAFIWNDEQKVKAYQNRETNKKKLLALERLSELKDISAYSDTLSKEELKNIMTYYLAVKHLRNQINHAVEEKPGNDDLILIRYLKQHGIQTDLTVEIVRNIILDGLHLTNPELV